MELKWVYLYFLHDEDRQSASPLYLPVGKNFPETLVFSAGLDPLRDESFAFVARLKGAGVSVKHRHFPGLVHVWLRLEDKVPEEASATYQAIGEFVRHSR